LPFSAGGGNIGNNNSNAATAHTPPYNYTNSSNNEAAIIVEATITMNCKIVSSNLRKLSPCCWIFAYSLTIHE